MQLAKGRNHVCSRALSLGYLTGKASSKILNVDLNIPLLFLISILPDIDLIIPGLSHRGATHSIVVCMTVFLPAFVIYRKRAVPYFISVTQHSLMGDFLTGGGMQILWPIASNWYGMGVEMTGLANIYLEWISFLAFLMIMLKTKDVRMLFQRHPSNLLLTIPVFAIILPSFLSFPLAVPLELIAPHPILLTLLAISIYTDLKSYFDRWF